MRRTNYFEPFLSLLRWESKIIPDGRNWLHLKKVKNACVSTVLSISVGYVILLLKVVTRPIVLRKRTRNLISFQWTLLRLTQASQQCAWWWLRIIRFFDGEIRVFQALNTARRPTNMMNCSKYVTRNALILVSYSIFQTKSILAVFKGKISSWELKSGSDRKCEPKRLKLGTQNTPISMHWSILHTQFDSSFWMVKFWL